MLKFVACIAATSIVHGSLLLLARALSTVWKHRANIDRLISGDEPRVGGAK